MSFSQKIKEEIFVATARHCCVCHRYKGVKIEIHHIITREKGGEDSYENAITLCFDCHCDAGHYNNKHPRGSKFSPSELKKHKENWIKIVQENKIPPKEKSSFHVRHLIIKEVELINEILGRDLRNFPIQNILLFETPIFDFIRSFFHHKQSFRHEEIQHILQINESQYIKRYPESKPLSNKDSNEYNFFYHERVPTDAEIRKYCLKDRLSKYLYTNNVKAKDISKVVTCYEGECDGEGRFQELFLLRPFYVKFLIISNETDRSLELNTLHLEEGPNLLVPNQIHNDHYELSFPDVKIEAGQSVLVPLGCFISDFKDFRLISEFSITETIPPDYRYQNFQHGRAEHSNGIQYLGSSQQPTQISYIENDTINYVGIHPFNFDNVYWVDRYYGYGSCPHLFALNNINEVQYLGEIFNVGPGIECHEIFSIDESVKKIIIAELEHEQTQIESVRLDDEVIYQSKKLNKGEILTIPILKKGILEIKGKYVLDDQHIKSTPLMFKYSIVNSFQNRYQQSIRA